MGMETTPKKDGNVTTKRSRICSPFFLPLSFLFVYLVLSFVRSIVSHPVPAPVLVQCHI